MSILAGVDIGGTKCAVSIHAGTADQVETLGRRQFPTPAGPGAALAALADALDRLAGDLGCAPEAIGVSCGGPLDARRGVVLSPPNLPGWDEVDVVTPFVSRFRVPAVLENDANAGALAEWRWGAGQGVHSLVFLTFGTGMGAGLILNGALYRGASDLAGEVGHWRLAEQGPVGFGKVGSFEGFCSGGGIARLAAQVLAEAPAGSRGSWLAAEAASGVLTTEQVGRAALAGDPLATAVLEQSGRRLGQALAWLVDLLNPELILLGSVYHRLRQFLEPAMQEVLVQEALGPALAACRIEPAGLGERVGDLASAAAALGGLPQPLP